MLFRESHGWKIKLNEVERECRQREVIKKKKQQEVLRENVEGFVIATSRKNVS